MNQAENFFLERSETRVKPKLIAILVMVVLFIIILIQNTQVIDLNLFFWTISMSQIILIVFVLLGGFIIGFLASMLSRNKS